MNDGGMLVDTGDDMCRVKLQRVGLRLLLVITCLWATNFVHNSLEITLSFFRLDARLALTSYAFYPPIFVISCEFIKQL